MNHITWKNLSQVYHTWTIPGQGQVSNVLGAIPEHEPGMVCGVVPGTIHGPNIPGIIDGIIPALYLAKI